MKRYALALSVALSSLAAPAVAQAATGSATVLTVSNAHHSVQVIDARHTVHTYGDRGAPKLTVGTHIHFALTQSKLTHVTASKKPAGAVSFYAKVAKLTASALVFNLGDNHKLAVTAKQLKTVEAERQHAGQTATISVKGMRTGENVLVTEMTSGDGLTVLAGPAGGTGPQLGSGGSAKAPAGTPAGVPAAGSLTGVVTATPGENATSFTITDSHGRALTFVMDASDLPDFELQWCDTVTVDYHSSATALVADVVQQTDVSPTGACAALDVSQTASVTIVSVDASAGVLTLSPGAGQPPLTLNLDEDPADGFGAGDNVTVTYSLQQDQSLHLDDIQYVDYSLTDGVITAVAAGWVTVNGTQTFAADDAYVAGATVGNVVSFTYNVIAGVPTVLGADASDAGPR